MRLLACQQGRRKRAFDHTGIEDEKGQSPVTKRRRVGSTPRYPPEFWDSLSRVPFTRGALRELDRRTTATSDTKIGAGVGRIASPRRLLRPTPRRLQAFADKGGPDLSTLRGYSNLVPTFGTMSESTSQSQKRSRTSRTGKSRSTDKTKNTSPYDAAFEQMMIDNGVYPARYRTSDGSRPPLPGNTGEIRAMLGQPRASLSPSKLSDTEFEHFQDSNEQAGSESQIMTNAVPFITGSKDRNFQRSGDIPFNNMEKIHPTITTPKPDVYYGARASDIHPRVQQDLGPYIVPSRNTSQPVVPNDFLAGKSKNGLANVAQKQAMYDNYVGARSMLQMQNYGNATPRYDGNAYSIASSYHPGTGTLQIYATHPAPPARPGGNTQYYTNQVGAYAMTHSPTTFRDGATAYRNAREWTKTKRDDFIENANKVAQSQLGQRGSVSGAKNRDTRSAKSVDPSGSDTSEDELSKDERRVRRRHGLR